MNDIPLFIQGNDVFKKHDWLVIPDLMFHGLIPFLVAYYPHMC